MNDDNPYKAPESLTNIELDNQNQANNSYPKGFLWKFGLYGSMLGGLLICVLSLPIAIFMGRDFNNADFVVLLMSPVMGLVGGFIPAFITGILVKLVNLHRNTWLDYLRVSLIGFFVSLVFFAILFDILAQPLRMLGVGESVKSDMTFFLSFIGTLSSVIMARLVLPKG